MAMRNLVQVRRFSYMKLIQEFDLFSTVHNSIELFH